MARDLADQHDHRRRILKRGVDADRGVAGTRPARHQQYPGLAAQFAVGLGHKGGTALLAAGHETDFGRVVERVEDFEIALAGDAEGHLDAMGAQRRDDELAAAEGRKIALPSGRPRALTTAPPFETIGRTDGRGLRQSGCGAGPPLIIGWPVFARRRPRGTRGPELISSHRRDRAGRPWTTSTATFWRAKRRTKQDGVPAATRETS